MNKKIISIVLTVCMLVSCLAVGSFSTQAVTTDVQSVSSGDQGPQAEIQGANILHCFNWSYNSIKANLKAIKDAGYTAVQTSPVQAPKDYSASWTDQNGQWWKLYQPITLSIADGNTWLGTKAELKALCTEAENYDIKVVVDIVANHMGNISGTGNNMSDISTQVESEIRNNSSYWHLNSIWANDGSRYDMTQGSIGEPDLNTGNSYIQNRVKNLLIDCINQGVDGFRFDAAKHIELPTDSGCGSDFWPTVINGSQSSTSQKIFYYGEILNGCGTDISNYTKYMSITDNYTSDSKLVAANSSDASGLAGSSYSKGAAPNKNVLWVESHDTYMGDSGSAGYKNTKNISNTSIVKAWAIVGSRANASSLFFARPASKMGDASSDTTWKSTAVSEVNKFKNYFASESEYLSSSGSVAYNERGTSGVVISKLDGAGSVSLTAKKMASGTYKDQVSGNIFTVSNGKISGTVGSSGVAVVYNVEEPGPSVTVNPGSSSYKTDTLSVKLNYNNSAKSGWYSIDGGAYKSFTDGQTITIGSGAAYGTVTTLSVKASDGSTTSEPVSYTYTKVDPSATQKIYFDNSSYNWSSVYAYIYSGSTSNGAWPGTKMTLDSATGYYVIEVPEAFAEGNVIFTESETASTNRYPADMEPGLSIGGKTMIFKANHEWSEYTAVQPTTAAPTTQPTTAQPTTAQPTTQPTTAQPTTTVPATTAPTERVLIGDVDFSGAINIKDATLLQKYMAGNIAPDVMNFEIAADVNGDGVISVKDATVVQYYVARNYEKSELCGTYVGGETPTTAPTTEPTTAPPSGNYIYFKNTSNWSTVKAYYWSTSDTTLTSWPGVEMESIDDSVYRIELPETAEFVIFNNGGGDQTSDITLEGFGKIYNNGSWSSYGGSTQPTTAPATTAPAPTGTYTIKFTNNKSWGTVNCYYWADDDTSLSTWPGVAMTFERTNSYNQDIYSIEVPSSADYIIINDGNGSKTEKISVNGSANYYISGTSGSVFTVETWE